jgi:hypothetical protein
MLSDLKAVPDELRTLFSAIVDEEKREG